MKKYLCGFANKKLNTALERFAGQAKEMDVYDCIYLYTEDDLEKDFYKHFNDKFYLRGFGYWVWKPQIILQTLSNMDDGDVLQYTDIGCHLNKNGKRRLLEYFEITSKTGLLGFTMTWFTEKQYTKGDLFDYFNVRTMESIFPQQICAGVLFIRKCEKNIEIIQKWLKVFYDDFSLVDDSPSKSLNFDEFIEHRHDQSIWSILAKLNNIFRFSREELNKFTSNPIWVLRDKGNTSKKLKVKRILKKVLPQSIIKILKNMYIKLKTAHNKVVTAKTSITVGTLGK